MSGLYYAANEFGQLALAASDDAGALAAGALLLAELRLSGMQVYFDVWFNDGLDYRQVGSFGPI